MSHLGTPVRRDPTAAAAAAAGEEGGGLKQGRMWWWLYEELGIAVLWSLDRHPGLSNPPWPWFIVSFLTYIISISLILMSYPYLCPEL